MRFCRNMLLALLIGLPLTAWQTPAFAISKKQWISVCSNLVGLRSGETPNDTNGAGYGMNDGKSNIDCFKSPPENWDTRLKDTLDFMLGFENAGNRYLIMLRPCHGNGGRYWDNRTFPKCPNAGNTIIAATAQTMGNYTVPNLIEWVMANIPN